MLQFQAEPSLAVARSAQNAASARSSSAEPLLHAVLNALPQAVVCLDADGGLVFWNFAARVRLVAAGWTHVDQRLLAPCAADREALSRALGDVCARGHMQLICLATKGRPTHAAVAPIDVLGQRRAMLLLDREALCGAIELQLFASGCGLTPSESRVMAGLSRGLRPTQIAGEHGVSKSTVHTQVAALRAKTQSASIAGLLACLARLPALKPARLGPWS